MTLYPGQIAVRIDAEGGRQDWGRFTELYASEGRVLARGSWAAGTGVSVDFTLDGAAFRGVRASVAASRADGEGYRLLRLVWTEERDRVRLKEHLLRLMK